MFTSMQQQIICKKWFVLSCRRSFESPYIITPNLLTYLIKCFTMYNCWVPNRDENRDWDEEEQKRRRGGDEAETRATSERQRREQSRKQSRRQSREQSRRQRRHWAETRQRRKTGRVPCDERRKARAVTRWRSALLYRKRAVATKRAWWLSPRARNERRTSSASNAAHWSGSRARLHKARMWTMPLTRRTASARRIWMHRVTEVAYTM